MKALGQGTNITLRAGNPALGDSHHNATDTCLLVYQSTCADSSSIYVVMLIGVYVVDKATCVQACTFKCHLCMSGGCEGISILHIYML